MAYGDALRTSWSVRHDSHGPTVERVFTDLVGACHTLCVEHFPRESGYEISISSLHGPIEGRTITVRRGTFRGIVSLQSYVSKRPAGDLGELRLVAAANHDDPPEQPSTLAPIAVATSALATLGVASLGSLTGVALLALFFPALLTVRMVFAMRAASDFQRKALQAAPWEKEESQACARAMAKDRRRWRAAMAHFHAQQDAVRQRFAIRPFRSLAPAEPLPLALPSSSRQVA